MRLKRLPRVQAHALLTVLGFLLVTAAAAVLGSMLSPQWSAGLGLLVGGACCLILGVLVESDGES